MPRHTWEPCYASFGLVMSTHYEPKTCIRGPKDKCRQNQDVFEIIFFNCWIWRNMWKLAPHNFTDEYKCHKSIAHVMTLHGNLHRMRTKCDKEEGSFILQVPLLVTEVWCFQIGVWQKKNPPYPTLNLWNWTLSVVFLTL